MRVQPIFRNCDSPNNIRMRFGRSDPNQKALGEGLCVHDKRIMRGDIYERHPFLWKSPSVQMSSIFRFTEEAKLAGILRFSSLHGNSVLNLSVEKCTCISKHLVQGLRKQKRQMSSIFYLLRIKQSGTTVHHVSHDKSFC